MERTTALAALCLLAVSSIASGAQTRNWLAPIPDTRETITADALTLHDNSINYGPRARVRLYRPDGVYEIDNFDSDAPHTNEGNRGPAPVRR